MTTIDDQADRDRHREDARPRGGRHRLDDLQQPGAPQRDVVRHAARGAAHPRRVRAPIPTCTSSSCAAPATGRSCRAPTSPSSRRSAPPSPRAPTTTTRSRPRGASWRMIDKPIIAMIRGYCIGGGLLDRDAGRHPHRRRRQPVRRAGGEARPRLRVRRRRGAHGPGRPVVGGGDPLLGPAADAPTRRCTSGWSTASCPSTSSRRRCASSRRAIAANAPLTVKACKAAIREARREPVATATSTRSSAWSRRASAPRTTSRGRPRSPRSATRASGALSGYVPFTTTRTRPRFASRAASSRRRRHGGR